MIYKTKLDRQEYLVAITPQTVVLGMTELYVTTHVSNKLFTQLRFLQHLQVGIKRSVTDIYAFLNNISSAPC